MFQRLSVSEQFRKLHTNQSTLEENPESIRVIPVAKLQSELCAVMNLTSDLGVPFFASNRGVITHAIIPATVFDMPAERFVALIENLVPVRGATVTSSKEEGGARHG